MNLMRSDRIGGMQILYSPHATEPTTKPVKVHRKRSWVRTNYHRRIQKKWIKRWGYFRKPIIIRTSTAFIVHPSLERQFRIAIRNQQ